MYKVSVVFSEDEKITTALRMLKKIEPEIPVFHTRAMRRKFQKEVASLNATDIKPHVLRHIYRTLTGKKTMLCIKHIH